MSIFSRECAKLWGSPLRVLAVLFYAGIATWALVDGLAWQRQFEEVLQADQGDQVTAREEWFADLRAAEAGEEGVSPYAARPMNLSFRAVHPPSDLALLAHRSEAMYPHTAVLRGWRSEASLFQRYEVEGPSALRSGRMDLAFVITTLFPLFLLMLSFDVLSQERSTGRFRLFLVQGGRATDLLAARLLAVALPLLLISGVAVAAAAVLQDAPGLPAAIWIIGLVAYAVFWCAIVAMIATVFAQPSMGALAVLASWALFVVALPSASQFAAQALYPVPSRVTFLSEARGAEGETRRNLTQRAEIYMAEHPDMSEAADAAVPGFYRASYLANIDINASTAPLVEEFERQQSAQRNLIDVVRWVSPTMSVQDLFFAASGTGPAGAAEFRRQARSHLKMLHETIGPATVNRARISVAAAEAIPEFKFTAPKIPRSIWLLPAWIALVGGFGLLWSFRRAEALC